MAAASSDYYIGFDVGTGSARACLVDRKGTLLADHSIATKTLRSTTDHRIFEQSTSDIWGALAACSKAVLAASGISGEQVKGVGFDATCSLAVVDAKGTPLSISRSADDLGGKEDDANLGKEGEWNVVLWADHRAEEEAEAINATEEGVLGFVGETMSLEMEIPKVLWLKKHMSPEKFKQCKFFDLPDYLTYRSTSSPARSTCSLACKCSYVPPGTTMKIKCEGGREEISTDGWSARFFEKIGLGEMVGEMFEALGGVPGKNGLVLTAGQPVGAGLNKSAAEDFGLMEGTAVGSGVIDAYAGWIGTVAAASKDADGKIGKKPGLEEGVHRLAAIAGTSTCHIAQSDEGILVPGVWGPYRDAIFPSLWMNEGGQSSTGQLIDFMVSTHPAFPKLQALVKETGRNLFDLLGERLETMRQEKGVPTTTHLTKDLHFYPDLHGNRSPLADPRMKGMITGLTLDDSLNDLARKFNVTLESIALQTRHIVDEMNSRGHQINSIYMSGSQAKNTALMGLLATVLQMPILIPPQPSSAVVLGAAMLGRYAHDLTTSREGRSITTQADAEEEKRTKGGDLWHVMSEMTAPAFAIRPREGEEGEKERKLLDVKYKIFREAVEIQKRWRDMIAAVA